MGVGRPQGQIGTIWVSQSSAAMPAKSDIYYSIHMKGTGKQYTTFWHGEFRGI